MLDSQIPSRTQGSIEAEVDGERILLSPKDFSYFGLTGTGAPVWDLIDGDRSVAGEWTHMNWSVMRGQS